MADSLGKSGVTVNNRMTTVSSLGESVITVNNRVSTAGSLRKNVVAASNRMGNARAQLTTGRESQAVRHPVVN